MFLAACWDKYAACRVFELVELSAKCKYYHMRSDGKQGYGKCMNRTLSTGPATPAIGGGQTGGASYG